VLVVHPTSPHHDAPALGLTTLYGAPPGTSPQGQGWAEVAGTDFLDAWLQHNGLGLLAGFSWAANRHNVASQMALGGVVAALGTGEWIAIVATVIAAGAAVIAYLQLKVSRRQLGDARKAARGQLVPEIDQAFAADEEIRVRLAKQDQPPLSREEWRKVKRYMGRFERVSVFVSQGLLEPGVVYRLYGQRMKHIIKNKQIRTTLLEGERARHWTDFIELWRVLDDMEQQRSGSHLCPGIAPPPRTAKLAAGGRALRKDLEDKD
jgi:hypothetical protein